MTLRRPNKSVSSEINQVETQERNMQNNKHFDTIIIGSGLAGSTLASILAKHGFSVLLIEKGSHPRFTINALLA
ncbi:MAG: NAD(P)-binding protein [Brasilonema sp.]